MVFVVLSGVPLGVDTVDLAEKINIHFGKNQEIGTFRLNVDDSDKRKPKVVLKFKQGFDAIEAQRELDNFKFINPEDKLIYNIKAVVPTNDQPYQSLFREKVTDIADVILAEKHKRKKEKKAKKRKHSPVDKNLLASQYGFLEDSLETADVEKLCKKLKSEKAERGSSRSDRSASESEYKQKNRDKSVYGETSGVSKRLSSPKDPIPKTIYKREQNLERKGEMSETSTNHERSRSSSRSERSLEDLRYRLESRRSSVRTKRREYESYYEYKRAPVDSPGRRLTSSSEGGSWSDKEKHSNNESTDSEFATIPELYHGRKLLVLEPSNYLNENDVEFVEAVEHIINTVATNTERLQDEDKKLILENYKTIVVDRLKRLKFTNLMSVQDIVLDYKLVYRTSDDKLLINNLIKELQALGKGILLPEIKREPLNQTIDEAMETTNIDQLMADVKLNIKSENILEYEYEDGETTVINIVVNLVPIEKRDLPFETDPDKVADIKMFVGKLKKTKPSKFFRPIRILLNEMKLFMYNNSKVVPTEVLLDRMVEVLEKILTRMMEPIKTRVKSRDVCNLFRNSFPFKEDQEFVEMIIKWIVNEEFDKGVVDRFVIEKIPKIEKNKTTDDDKSTNVHMAPIETQPQDTDTKPKLPVPIKMEIKTDNEDNNHSEQTVTTNTPKIVEQQTKDVEIQLEKQTNVVVEKIDEDIIIMKEPVDVILIEDDDLVSKKEIIDDNITAKGKLETIKVSGNEDEGALSDDSTTTQVIETKPFFGNDENMEQGAPGEPVHVKSEELLSEPGETLGESGETLGESGGILDGLAETIEDIRQYIKSEN